MADEILTENKRYEEDYQIARNISELAELLFRGYSTFPMPISSRQKSPLRQDNMLYVGGAGWVSLYSD